MARARWYWGTVLLLLLNVPFICYAQETPPNLSTIDSLLTEKKVAQATAVLTQNESYFLAQNQLDSLALFPIYVGKIAKAQGNGEQAAKRAEDFIKALKTRTSNARILFYAYLNLDNLYVYLEDDASSLAASKTALEYATSLPDVTPEELGRIHYAIGGNYYALYDLSNASLHFRQSVKYYEQSRTVKKFKLADSYNGVAVSMWTLNKLDSAQIYFDKAIIAAKESDLTAFDRLYYITAFEFNLALVFDDQGSLGEAIDMKKKIIKNLERIIKGSDDDFLVKKSKRLQASAISNLAAFYHDTGYLSKANEMVTYAYEKKKEVYDISNPRLATALNQIATSEIELKEFDKSIATVQKALTNLKLASSEYVSVEAELYFSLAKAYSEKKDIPKAIEFYEKSEAFYRKAYPVEYSREYLHMRRNYTQFLADHGDSEKALQLAEEAYTYILNQGGSDPFPILKEITNLSQLHYTAGDFENSYLWAQKGNDYLDKKLADAKSVIDSIQIEIRRPTISLLEVQSLYKIEPNHDTIFLQNQIKKLDKAVSFLERQKTTTYKRADINRLLAEYKSLNEISKKLYFDLYKSTQNIDYLDRLMMVQESGIYNRIRTQFNIRNNISFQGVSSKVLQREELLKQRISTALNSNEQDKIETYFRATEAWDQFLDSLQTSNPKYYQLRYATIEQPLTNVQASIPKNTTVVRYFFIESNLFALVVSNKEERLIAMNSEALEQNITLLGEDQATLEIVAPLYHSLYQQLWAPVASLVTTEEVIIIPSGILFNLSFETLTHTQISNFRDMAKHSLLSQHAISYNYSLLLINKDRKSINYHNNFVAFAPEFSPKMKQEYQVAISDSNALDKTYLTLLPQPFSAAIADEYSKVFKGNLYLNDRSTKQLFTANAKEHKIIHIATHAESNNLSPELSRLVFAKNTGDSTLLADNYLYTYEIYNENLSSNLAILTACETGKPTFQSGEGMISLAHAFNYAGSESILTSLWKIDEKSSTDIVRFFYKNLEEGMHKDIALQRAKLQYLSVAEGRTLAPQYWAGLVLIGDAAPIKLSTGIPIFVWFIGGMMLLLYYVFKDII